MNKDFELELDEIDKIAYEAYGGEADDKSDATSADDKSKDPDTTGDADDNTDVTGNSDNDDDQAQGEPQNTDSDQADKDSDNDQPDGNDLFKTLSASLGEEYGSAEGIETLKEKLSKAASLEKEVEELKKKSEEVFANKRVETLNNLYKAGKTEEQISEYMSLSKMGDLSKLSAREVLIQQQVKNGATRSFAEKLIDRKYPIPELDEDTMDDAELAKAKDDASFYEGLMENDARQARAEIEEYISELTSIEETSPEDKALLEQAAKVQYQQKLEPLAQKLKESFPEKIDIEGINLDVESSFRDGIVEEAKAFFFDIEVNEESVKDFLNAKKADFIMQNFDKISKALVAHGKNLGAEEMEKKFVNPEGVNRYGDTVGEIDETITDDQVFASMLEAAE